MKILLVGYYGHGNFGDDVLFVVTYRLVRSCFPDAQIAVQTEAADADYLDALTGSSIPMVRMGERRHFDLIVHGGGGNFFDFADGSPLNATVNGIARLLGARAFTAIYRSLRSVVGRRGITGERRVALGLGIGTYTATARRLVNELPVLADMAFLGVRDQGSIANLQALGIRRNIHRTGDLAFAGGWSDQRQGQHKSDVITVVLRDWNDATVNRVQLEALETLASIARVRVLLLDRKADRSLLRTLKTYEIITYKPGDFAPVIAALATASAIVTARAHGAICGVMLDTPAVLLPIEPKLNAVHSMLPRSTVLPGAGESLDAAVKRALAITPADLQGDVSMNRKILSFTASAALRGDRTLFSQ